MKFQTINKIKVYKGEYGFSTRFSTNIGDKEKPEWLSEYVKVYFDNEITPNINKGEIIEIMVNNGELGIYHSKKNAQLKFKMNISDFTIIKETK